MNILAIENSWLSNELMPFIFNMVIAIIPSILLCYYVYKKDVIEKEPLKLLFKLFLMGIVITLPASFVEKTIISSFNITTSSVVGCLIVSFLVVALIEEGYKFVVTYLCTWKNKNFDHIFDGIVYATFVSIGFASLENILYVLESGTETAILRAIISVPAHAFYAVTCGYYLGLSKFSYSIGNKKMGLIYKILSFIVPILLHGIFDFLLLTNNSGLTWVFFVFVATLYIISFFNIKKFSKVQMTSNMQ